jgi:DNA-binding Xre family transcriptional regulator
MGLSQIIQRAMEIGEPNGTITFDQLNELCCGLNLEPEDIDRLLAALNEKGVRLVNQ